LLTACRCRRHCDQPAQLIKEKTMPAFRRLMFRYADDPNGNVVVDVLMDDRRHWLARVPTGGWWGRIHTNEMWPFILLSDGRMDFGSAADDPADNADRYASIDIEDRILAVGEQFVLAYHNELWPMTLDRITDITEL
jgi:hypothetical protein